MSYRAASYSGIRTIRWKIEFYSMDLDATQIIRVRVILHRGIRTITTRVRVVHAFTTKVVNPELSFSCLARIDSNKLDHDNVVLRPRPRSPRRAASPPATADGAGQSPPPRRRDVPRIPD